MMSSEGAPSYVYAGSGHVIIELWGRVVTLLKSLGRRGLYGTAASDS